MSGAPSGAAAGGRRWPWPALLLVFLLLWLVGYPLLLTFLGSLRGDGGFTLAHWSEFFGRRDEWLALWRSCFISLLSVVLAALLGVPLAFAFERLDFPGRRVLGALVALPIALPPLVGVFAFYFLFGETGFLARGLQLALGLSEPPWRLVGPGAILLVHAYSMYVYFYLFVRAALSRLDASLLEAAGALGASRARTFFKVELPQLRPALLGASLLVFMTSLGSFSAPYIFGGGYQVMTTRILASKTGGQLGLVQVEAAALAIVALAVLWLIRRFQGQEVALASHGVAPARKRIERRWVRVASAALGYAAAFLLLLPHLTLILISFVPMGTWSTELLPPVYSAENYHQLFADPQRLQPILNSLWMAAVAAAGAILLGFVAARQALRRGGFLGGLLEGLIALPWAIPATVFALALALTFSTHEPWLLRFVWVGTPIILPLAYLVRCLPITGRSALAGLRQIDPSLEEAAAILGASRARTFWKVVLPRVRPALQAGLGLAFITALGDYVASIVVYTVANQPISMEIDRALRHADFGVGAAYGVLLMVLSSAAFLLWGRGDA